MVEAPILGNGKEMALLVRMTRTRKVASDGLRPSLCAKMTHVTKVERKTGAVPKRNNARLCVYVRSIEIGHITHR